jgi:hypothetical protein
MALTHLNRSLNGESSSVWEFHPHALTDQDVNLSAHPAPIDQPEKATPVERLGLIMSWLLLHTAAGQRG